MIHCERRNNPPLAYLEWQESTGVEWIEEDTTEPECNESAGVQGIEGKSIGRDENGLAGRNRIEAYRRESYRKEAKRKELERSEASGTKWIE